MTFPELTPTRLREMIDNRQELAILDVREEAEFARDGHLFLATSAPFSRISCLAQRLVPRRETPIVLCDAGRGLVDGSAAKLEALDFQNVNLLRATKEEWHSGGFEIFYGVNVPSKAFGEFVQEHDKTPDITPQRLSKLREEGDLLILDCRPPDEYGKGTIPGAINCPASELAYRIPNLVTNTTTRIVVNCAGRTRSIIGAQSLIAADTPNPAMALKGGVMGWRLAGFEPSLEPKSAPHQPPPPETIELQRARTQSLAERAGVQTMSLGTFHDLTKGSTSSIFLFDVRPNHEFLRGHLPGARNVLGVQLVQKADSYIGILRATVALTDDTGVRAWMTAYWLARMGLWNVVVIDGRTCLDGLIKGREQPTYQIPKNLKRPSPPTSLAPPDLTQALSRKAAIVIDLAPSNIYKAGHIPEAKYASPATIDDHLSHFEQVVLTSPDGCLAEIAARETRFPVAWLRGGTSAWHAAGLPLETGSGSYLDTPQDVFVRPYEQSSGQTEAMREYLEWEIGLLSLLKKDRSAIFHAP